MKRSKKEKVKSLLQTVENDMKENCIDYGSQRINVNKISMSDHAFKRADQRFGITDRSKALSEFRQKLKHAKIIGTVKDDYGNDCYLYGAGKTAIVIATDEPLIITVYRQDGITYDPLKRKVAELHAKEFRKLQRTEIARVRRLETVKLEADLEIAECKYRIHKTRSASVRIACQGRINAVNMHVCELENEIKQIQSTKKSVAKSMISVI
jgi:hypothetical protein